MNFKNLFIGIVLAFVTTYAFNSFFFKPASTDSKIKSGQSFIAPENPEEIVPLAKEISFLPSSENRQAQLTRVSTSYGDFTFSDNGAVLERLSFRGTGGSEMVTIGSQQLTAAQKAFALGLNVEAPAEYTLDHQSEDHDSHIISYSARTNDCTVKKTFTVSKLNNKLQLSLELAPVAGRVLRPRIVFPSPFLDAVAKDDLISGLVYTDNDVLKKIAMKSLDAKQGWIAPALFGSENKYFIHAMVGETQTFARRAYFATSCNSLVSILEGPAVSEPSQWMIDFYLGPKTEKAIRAVDARLDSAVEYSGLLAPLARLMLFILAFLFSYCQNYGLAIILVTLLIKIVLFPIIRKTRDAAKRQAEIEKKMAYIKKKYQDDPELYARERAELIRKYGMPGAVGLLPLLVQIAMMYSLSRVIGTSVDFYQAPFLWISNLSATDPYYLLPISIVIAMIFNALSAHSSQRVTMLAVALVFGAFAVNLSAGLALYIATNALLDGMIAYFAKK